MMKKIFYLFTLLPVIVFGQVFYKGTDDKDFKRLIANGLTYLPSGNEVVDNAYIAAFQEKWKVTDFRIFDKSTMSIEPDDVVVTPNQILNERVLSGFSTSSLHPIKKDGQEKCQNTPA